MAIPADTGPPLAGDLGPLRSVAAARVDNKGHLLEANTGFRALLPGRLREQDSPYVTHIIIQPPFGELLKLPPDADEPAYTGPMTLGEYSGQTHSLVGRVMRYPDGIRIVAEYNVDEIERLYKLSIEQVYTLAEKERELTAANRRIRELSVTDPLTGLSNRRRLDEYINTESRRAERHGKAFSVVICDLDHFKRINDTYGHPIGDSVLVAFARLLNEYARKTDFIARYGGEEFVIVMPETRATEAAQSAERIRRHLEAHRFDPGPAQVTASFGISDWQPGITVEQVLDQADRALYRAKQEGRNKIFIARWENLKP